MSMTFSCYIRYTTGIRYQIKLQNHDNLQKICCKYNIKINANAVFNQLTKTIKKCKKATVNKN